MIVIAIEGLDKAGKRTALDVVRTYFEQQGSWVETLSFPRYDTPIGQLIRGWLYNELDVSYEAFELLQAADKVSAFDLFKDFDSDGVEYVICDRYLLSQLAYGSVHNNTEWVQSLIKPAYKADLTIYLDVSVEESMDRNGEHGHNDKYEADAALLQKVSDTYKTLLRPSDILIDATDTVENVRKSLLSSLAKWHYENTQ